MTDQEALNQHNQTILDYAKAWGNNSKINIDKTLTPDQAIAVLQLRALNSINAKLTFIVVVIIVGIVLSLLH